MTHILFDHGGLARSDLIGHMCRASRGDGMLTSWIPPCDSGTSQVICFYYELLDLFESNCKYLISDVIISARTTKITIILSVLKFHIDFN